MQMSVRMRMRKREDNVLPDNPAFDSAEAEEALDPGDILLKSHGTEWHMSSDGVTVDVTDRYSRPPRII